MAPPDRVFIDTSELFPFTVMDLLLTLSEHFVFTWVWTDELLDEWERVIVERGQRTEASARSVTDAVRTWFAASRLDPGTYRDAITDELSPDPDDRVHVAACLDGRADVLLTRDIKHFPVAALADRGLQVMTADAYLVGLLTRRPSAVQDAFLATASARRRPPVTACELADRLERAGSPVFATRIRRRLGCE